MKIKESKDVYYTSDFWYDLFEGGYLEPTKMLDSATEIQIVEEAVAVLRNYKASLYKGGRVNDI